MTPLPPTFEALLARIAADPELAPARAGNLASSLRRFVAICGRTPQAEASVPAVRRWIEAATPGAQGVSRRRWANIRSEVGFALRRYEAPTRAPLPKDLAADWARMRLCLGGEIRLMRGLSNLIHWCSREGIAPDRVDDAVMERYLEDLRARSLKGRPEKRFREVCRLWNRAAETCPGWPSPRVTVPTYRKKVSFSWDAFPAPFLADLDRYCAFMSGRDLLAEHAPAAPRRQTTLASQREHLRRFASGLVRSGFPMENLTGLSVLVVPENFETAVRFHLDRRGGKPWPGLFETAAIVVVVAKEYLRLEADRIARLRTVRNRLKCRKKGMTKKNRERLRPLIDPLNQIRFLTFADNLVASTRKQKNPKRQALDVQTALVHELLVVAPMRFGNLTGLNLQQHVRRVGSGHKQRVFIFIPADEVKNTVELEFELPPPTIALLDLYLDKHRPRLLKGPEEGWLFPGQKGGHKHEVGLRERLCRVIERVTGLVLNPHLYRHVAAFFYLQEHPGDYETVRLLLGHKSVETTITFYAEFEALTARRIYAEHILERRQRTAAAPERAAW